MNLKMYEYFGNYLYAYIILIFFLFESTLIIKRVRNNSIIDKAYKLKKDIILLIIFKNILYSRRTLKGFLGM